MSNVKVKSQLDKRVDALAGKGGSVGKFVNENHTAEIFNTYDGAYANIITGVNSTCQAAGRNNTIRDKTALLSGTGTAVYDSAALTITIPAALLASLTEGTEYIATIFNSDEIAQNYHKMFKYTGEDVVFTIAQAYHGNYTNWNIYTTATSFWESHVFGWGNVVCNNQNLVGGSRNYVTGSQNLVGAYSNTVSGQNCVVGGSENNVAGYQNEVVGNTNTVSGSNNNVSGDHNTVNNVSGCVVGGNNNTLSNAGQCAVFGTYNNNTGSAYESLIAGQHNANTKGQCTLLGEYLKNTKSSECLLIGSYNVDVNNAYRIVGNGSGEAYRSNIEVLDSSGNLSIAGALTQGGADYAEYYEWSDGNPNDDDRRGRFVTLDGEQIRLADSSDDYILGVISAAPAIVGNAAELDWHGRFRRDVFGAFIYENGYRVITDDYIAPPDDAPYIPRAKRKEWSPVGFMGQFVAVDDGTCIVNGYCQSGENGIATAAQQGYRVMARVDDTHIKITIK